MLILDATARQTIGFIVRNSVALIVAGVGVGFVAAALLARSMVGILYGVSTFDIIAFGVPGVVSATAGISTSLVPVRRAVRIDPMVALQQP